MDRFPSVAAFLQQHQPEAPVHLLRPHGLARAAATFLEGFPGDTLYAVKCNAHPLVLRTLWDAGIRHFDVASPMEIERVVDTLPGGTLYYHHPAKTPGQIRLAWGKGVRHYAVDCCPEVDKLTQHAGPGAIPVVRLAIPKGSGAVYDLSTKFGAPPDLFIETLGYCKARGFDPAVTFHVGSQCLDPAAFRLGLSLAADCIKKSGVAVDWIDVGGGFPAYYRTTQAPPLADFFAAIRAAHAEFTQPLGLRLACEPGRAIAGGGGSVLVRINLRKPRSIYLNDGIFGGLTETYWGKDQLALPMRVIDPQGRLRRGEAVEVTAWGPTCDGNDRLPWPLMVPETTAEGDYVEFDLIAAYGREMAASYNGMRSTEMVVIESDFAGHMLDETLMTG
jgi:ornithine decarboxylase